MVFFRGTGVPLFSQVAIITIFVVGGNYYIWEPVARDLQRKKYLINLEKENRRAELRKAAAQAETGDLQKE